MFRYVVYTMKNNKYKVISTDSPQLTHVYTNIEHIPADIQTKLKQLMWVSPTDTSMTETLGMRVGENAYWIL